MNAAPLTFEAYLLAKGIADMSALHPNELRTWKASYDVEITGAQAGANGEPVYPPIRASADDAGGSVPGLQAGALPSMTICACADDFKLEAAAAGEDPKAPKKFSMTAYTGVPMRLQGWGYPVVASIEATDKGEGIKTRQSVPIDHNHDHEKLVGHSTAIDKSPQRLYANGVISGHHDTEMTKSAMAAREVRNLAAGGFPWQASIMADPAPGKVQFVDKGESVKCNGRVWNGPLYAVWESNLKAISFVANGADSNSSANVAAAYTGNSNMNDQWIIAQGFDPKTLSDIQRKFLQAIYDQQQKPPVVTPPPVVIAPVQASATDTTAEIRAAAAAEVGRIAAVRRICAAAPGLEVEIDDPAKPGQKLRVGIESQAISAGWDETKTELAVLRAARNADAEGQRMGPHGFVRQEPRISEQVLEAAALQALGYSFTVPDFRAKRFDTGGDRPSNKPLHVPDKSFDDKTLQAAHDIYRGRISIQQFIIATARLGGFHGHLTVIRDENDIRECIRAGFAPVMKADGFSTASLPNILSNLQNKFMLQGYWGIDSVWRKIAAVRTVKDFKLVNSMNLTGDFNSLLVAADGELKHSTYGEEIYTNQVDTYGRTSSLTRKMLINDDLGALGTVPMKLGRGAALGINKVFWTAFLAASSGAAATNFWTSAPGATDGINANYFTGAGTTLQSSQLAIAEQMFNDQVDPNGEPLGYDPAMLLVPSSLYLTAREINKSERIVGPTTSKQPDRNIFTDLYEPVMSRYIGSSRYANSSQTAWYLLADPMDVALIELAFLNGQESPTVQTFTVDPDQLGITMRCFLDFGVGLQSKRAGVKSKGAA